MGFWPTVIAIHLGAAMALLSITGLIAASEGKRAKAVAFGFAAWIVLMGTVAWIKGLLA